MSRLAWLVMVAAATGCGDQERRSCKDVLDHVQRTLTNTPSAYFNTYIAEGDCAQMPAATRSCLGTIKSGEDMQACAKGNPKLAELIADGIAAKLLTDQRVTVHHALAYRRAGREWRDNNPNATECATLVQLEQQTSSPHTLRDRWGSEYVVVCSALGLPEVFSPGPDKKSGTEDDIGAGWVEPQLRPVEPGKR